MPLLMLGGVYLCLEGMEKLAHPLLHGKEDDAAHDAELEAMLADPAIDLLQLEAEKVKGAIRTDFVLSAEIIAITLGTVASAAFTSQLVVLVGVALIMTVGVYGFVGLLVKLDDIGLFLLRRGGAINSLIGRGLIQGMPWLMKALAVIGTVAMFMVGGGIISHGWPWLHHAIEGLVHPLSHLPGVGALARLLLPAILDVLVGMVAGAGAGPAFSLAASATPGFSCEDGVAARCWCA
jgi:predicted DNA repair protein MutK